MNILCVDNAVEVSNEAHKWWDFIHIPQSGNLRVLISDSKKSPGIVEDIIKNITNYGYVDAILVILESVMTENDIQEFPLDVIFFNFLTGIDLLCSYAYIKNIKLLMASRSKVTSLCMSGVEYYEDVFIDIGGMTELSIADAFTKKLADICR